MGAITRAGGLRRRLRGRAGAVPAAHPAGDRAAAPARSWSCSRAATARRALAALVALHHLVTVEDAKVVVAAASRAAGDAPVRLRRALRLRARATRTSCTATSCCGGAREPGQREGLDAVAGGVGVGRAQAARPDVLAGDRRRAPGARRRDGVYVAMASALHKRPGAQLVTISTAGQGTDSPLGRLRARALALPQVRRRGAVTDARGAGAAVPGVGDARGRRR